MLSRLYLLRIFANMADQSNYYLILGMSTNNVIESVILEGYTSNDVYYYLMTDVSALEHKYPFIYKQVLGLLEIYKNQYKLDPNVTNFKTLVDTSDELNSNFIKIMEYSPTDIINVCSYYQNNKKTIALKTDKPTQTITLKDLAPEQSIPADPKAKIELKPKIALKKKT